MRSADAKSLTNLAKLEYDKMLKQFKSNQATSVNEGGRGKGRGHPKPPKPPKAITPDSVAIPFLRYDDWSKSQLAVEELERQDALADAQRRLKLFRQVAPAGGTAAVATVAGGGGGAQQLVDQGNSAQAGEDDGMEEDDEDVEEEEDEDEEEEDDEEDEQEEEEEEIEEDVQPDEKEEQVDAVEDVQMVTEEVAPEEEAVVHMKAKEKTPEDDEFERMLAKTMKVKSQQIIRILSFCLFYLTVSCFLQTHHTLNRKLWSQAGTQHLRVWQARRDPLVSQPSSPCRGPLRHKWSLRTGWALVSSFRCCEKENRAEKRQDLSSCPPLLH
jgi:hypothetical protein